MSVFGDFQQVWLQRFPDSPLPGAWEEDVRANLSKHKQKVLLLKEELEKEQFYVEYLERLLSDVEQHKKRVENGKSRESLNDGCDLISVSLSKENLNEDDDQESKESKANSANMCINELSQPSNPEEINKRTADDGTFVTVIEVNGLKSTDANSSTKPPPKIPDKPDFTQKKAEPLSNASRSESLESSSEILITDEPYYDLVAAEEESNLQQSDTSSTENVFSTASTLPLGSKHESIVQDPQSPGTSNYVNIEYFIKCTKGNDNDPSSSDDEQELQAAPLSVNVDNSSYASSSSLESSTPSTRRKFSHEGDAKIEAERMTMYRCILLNTIDSETNYVEWLGIAIKYMKAIQSTLGTSQPIVTETELRTIFYKIPELYTLHVNFLESLQRHTQRWDSKIGESFKTMANNLTIYGAFLSNYGRAIDTVRKCSSNNSQFNEITKNITCKQLSGQPVSLEDLLHKPVARVQKNALVLHDILKYVHQEHPDYKTLNEALKITQHFLDQFNMIQTKSMFPAADRAQRRLVKNSFIVEFADNHRKLRHLFLFNDVIACAKYKSSGRTEKYTFELKWFIPVEDIIILEETTANLHEVPASNIVALKSQASNVRDQLRQEEKILEDKKIRVSRGSEKFRKRLVELESQLVLVSPNLVFRIKNRTTTRTYLFFLSSDFERTQWIEAIQTLQRTGMPPSPTTNNPSMFELQTWITACRTFLKTNMGSYLLRSGQDESLLVGDLHVFIYDLVGLEYTCDLYISIEVDFYGHFFQKAKTKIIGNTNNPVWNENFIIDLEGCENLRILIYRESNPNDTLFGKHTQKLSRQWLLGQGTDMIEKKLLINGCTLRVGLKFIPCEVSLRRVPTGKVGNLFGEKIQQICKKQKRDVPFIVTACIREVERRGMQEVGIYRVSGSALDLTKLKKSFETNSYEAEQLLKEVDIHSVTGILKLFLRELPEALFTDQLYPTLLESFNQSNGNLKKRTELLNDCFTKLPQQNRATISCILDHLIRVHKYENDNKMSLHNLATVFGPTLLRPSIKGDSKHKDIPAATVDVMAQAGILYCYLQDLNNSQSKC